jgi:hypothetical protein
LLSLNQAFLLWNFHYLSVDTYIALFISAIATGIVYVAGLSYVNIRAEKKERPMRIAVCHAWKTIGFGAVVSIYMYLLDDTGYPTNDTLNLFYQILGYAIIGSSAVFIFLLIINEFRQRQGIIYNYKDCLDHDNAIANNYCKLFSKHEVIIERNPTVSAAGLWKSTENLLPQNKPNYTNWWTVYLLLPKLHGAVMFHYLLMSMTLGLSHAYVDGIIGLGITLWIMMIGAILGCVWLRFFEGSKLFSLTSTFAVTALGVSFVFYKNENQTGVICLWIYYFSVSIASAVPDICLMEIAKIRFSEGALAVGFFLEIIPIAVLQSLQREAHLVVGYYWYTDKYQLHMPNTYNKSLLQIQNELLKFKKYFAFDFDNHVTSTVPRRSSDSNHYLVSNSVNVFEDHAKTITTSEVTPPDYTEVEEKLPDPPVNKATNFDYNTDIPKPPVIIPRVNIAKGSNSLYSPRYEN